MTSITNLYQTHNKFEIDGPKPEWARLVKIFKDEDSPETAHQTINKDDNLDISKEELEAYLLSVRVKPQSEIEDAASTYIVTGKHGRQK